MDTHEPQHDTPPAKTDPAFDALLDDAVAQGTPLADPELAERIYNETAPMLGHRPVLARIGPTLLRAAAAVAIIAGGLIAVTVMHETQTPTDSPVAKVDVEAVGPELAELDEAVEPGNTLIDERLDMLALRVDLASTDEVWEDASLGTSELIDEAVARFEMDQLSEDQALLTADDSVLF